MHIVFLLLSPFFMALPRLQGPPLRLLPQLRATRRITAWYSSERSSKAPPTELIGSAQPELRQDTLSLGEFAHYALKSGRRDCGDCALNIGDEVPNT